MNSESLLPPDYMRSTPCFLYPTHVLLLLLLLLLPGEHRWSRKSKVRYSEVI